MAVYVDNMRAPVKRGGRTYVLCHMTADSSAELHAMAERIGVARKWCQGAETYREHYDVCLAKRARAVAAGAEEITMMETGRKMRARREARHG